MVELGYAHRAVCQAGRCPWRLVPSGAVLPALALDITGVLLFVAAGRRSHEEAGGLGATFEIAAPFLIALAVAWVVVRAWREPRALRTGLIIWPVTVALGQLLRKLVFDRGTATAFIIVSAVALGVLLVGWRAVAHAVDVRLARSHAD